MTIDIIIPVYNAFDYLLACVESIRRNAGVQPYRLILVEDCSTDVRILPYLHSLENGNVIVLRNETNQGFVHSVNRGIQASENDVVLLNSDTEVTPHWLERLTACACHDSRVATATPFTNAGTICSVPVFCQDNPLPERLTADAYAALIERVSLRAYPEIPTAVGFCMYIRRAVLNQIGLFDEDAFGKGYGEENDFCYRALRAGYRHVLCDDVFVYHKGSASFGDVRKQTQIQKNLEILANRYPEEKRQTDLFCRMQPLRRFWDNIDVFRAFANGRRNLLFVLHMPVPYRQGDSQMGGTQKHVLELCRALDKRYNVFILWPEKEDGLCLIGSNGSEWKELFFSLKLVTSLSYEDKIRQVLSEVLKAFCIDLVHIHHILGLTPAMFDTVRRAGIPCVFTAHDYYLFCPQINLLKNGVYCGGDAAQCADCPACAGISIADWRQQMGKALSSVQAVVVPDESVQRRFEQMFPGLPVEVHEHGICIPELSRPVQTVDSADTELFPVAFVGNVAQHKGSARIAKVIAQGGTQIDWHVFGNVEDKSFRPMHAHLHGPYQGAEILALLRQYRIRLVCFLPVWPETYSYVLTECWLAGVPVLAYDLGAVGNRIRKTGCGWVLPPDAGATEIVREIQRIRGDAAEYATRLNALEQFHAVSLEEMGKSYAQLYERLFGKPQICQGYDRALIVSAVEAAAKGTETMGLAYGAQLEGLRQKLRKILPRPMADALLRGQYPFKKQIKRVAVLAGDVLRRLRR
ncbi:glycosyltransferase [Ethanoligenens sp.]|uniref:glycosyltransferase n=1 Tax=Ethanoligenens sp. TaxID=2099655 RepID=UPI0039EC97C9